MVVPWPLPPPWPEPPLVPPTRYQKDFWRRAGPGERYRCEGVLGAGGQARLWRAVDTRRGRTVVVKTLREDGAGRVELRRLVREGRILHDLAGVPAVMELLDYGPENQLRGTFPQPGTAGSDVEETGTDEQVAPGWVVDEPAQRVQTDFPWLVLPLYRHRRLDDALQDFGPFGSATGRALGRDLAEVLAVLHRNEVSHRDLTPGNVLLTASGLVLADFGVAWSPSYRDVDGARPMTTGLTRAAGLPQTPGWSAPEVKPRSREDRSSRNQAVDVFGWGLFVATAAAGRHPWADPDRLGIVVEGEPEAMAVTPPRLVGIVDRGLRDVVAAALSPDPDDRPTADQLRDWLEADSAAAGSPVPRSGGSTGTPARPLPTTRHERALHPSLGLVAVVLLIIVVLLLWAAGVFRLVTRELAPFEQGTVERTSSLEEDPPPDRPPATEVDTG